MSVSDSRNNQNRYGDRMAVSVTGGVAATVLAWVSGVEALLWWHDGHGVGPGVLLAILVKHGPAPIRMFHGWQGAIPSVVAVLAGVLAGGAIFRWLTIPAERHVRGYILRRNPKEIARALKPQKGEPAGVRIHPAVQITEGLECRHTMLIGGSGGGKTTVLWPLIRQARDRGDKVLLFDSKGDFTEKLTGDFTLLSPTDARSSRWTLGQDVATHLDSQALCETLVPSSPDEKEPMWGNGARALLAGVINNVQRQQGQSWGFVALAQAMAATLVDYDLLKSIILEEDPAMIVLLGGEDAEFANRTTLGFLVQIAAQLKHVTNFGVGAADYAQNPAWSVRAWLAGKTTPTVVLGYRDSARSLSRAWTASLLEQIVRQLSDMPDAPPDQRRIWLILDEAPWMGRVPSITDALTTLRSKGVRIVLGIQSLAQTREIYGRETATIWSGQCASKVICATNTPEDQEWCSKLLGEREVERYQHQTSQQFWTDTGAQHSSSWQRVREPVLLPSTFGQELRVLPKGPRALLMSGGEAALLDWPFPSLQKHREPFIAARWVRAGYQRPVWGKLPPALPPIAGDRPEEPKPKGPKGPKGLEGSAKRQAPAQTPLSAPGPAVKKPDPTPAGKTSGGESLTDHAAQEIAGHVLDMALPGAGIAARILGIVAQAAPGPSQAAPPLTPGIPAAGHQQEERDDGREAEE